MPLEIEDPIADHLPSMVKETLAGMTPEKQARFAEEYRRRSKSFGLMFILAIFFPIQLFLLGKRGLGVLFLLTFGGLGIWYLIEIIITYKRVGYFNEELSRVIIWDMKIVN